MLGKGRGMEEGKREGQVKDVGVRKGRRIEERNRKGQGMHRVRILV